MNKYIGHESQLYGVDEMIFATGRAEGMRVLQVVNGKGLEMTLNLSKCLDILKLKVDGKNMGYISPCGYVNPAFRNPEDFLNSFTAGFLTTCGLDNAGGDCEDEGEKLPLHGTLSSIPCERCNTEITDKEIIITAWVRDAKLFGRKFLLKRRITCSLIENSFSLKDEITNIGTETAPYMTLYHFNIGYPMLSENAVLDIPYDCMVPRDDDAAAGMEEATLLQAPEKGFKEQCFYYDLKSEKGIASLSLSNPDIGKRMTMSYQKDTLDCFTEWKMMGEYEYVLGLEPGNCLTEGRKTMRENGILKFLNPEEKVTHNIEFCFENL